MIGNIYLNTMLTLLKFKIKYVKMKNKKCQQMEFKRFKETDLT